MLGCAVELHLGIRKNTLSIGSGAVTGNGGSNREIGDLSSHLLLIDLVFLLLLVRGALKHQTLLLHMLAHLRALRLKCGRFCSVAGGGGAHGFSMTRLPLCLKLGNSVLSLSFELGAVSSSLSPELGELFDVSTLRVGRVCFGITGVLGEPGVNTRHGSLRSLNGGPGGRLSGDNSRLQSHALALQSSNLSSQGK